MAESDLVTLLRTMRPQLMPESYVFITVRNGHAIPAALAPIMTFLEAEGTTLIVEASNVERHGVTGTFPSRLITLTVNSALDAVGFLAAVTSYLARAGISVNAVSAYFHDHLFVPRERAGEALELLNALSRELDV